jgi:RNA polymerase sigma factor (sigma-70 family)
MTEGKGAFSMVEGMSVDETVEKTIKQVLSGDDNAFSILVDLYKNRVFSLAYRMISSQEESEDLSQEVFLKVYSNLKYYDPKKAGFSTWIYRITYNQCVDYLRRKKNTIPLEEKILPVFSETPEEKVITSEKMQSLNKAVNKLPEVYRIPLILYHFHGLSYKEICQVMDVPMSIVKNRLFRARKMLKETLTGGVFYVM